MTADNPKAALAALTTPGRLTLGRVAMLCRIESPILAGRIDDLNDTLAALYVIEAPLAEVVANAGRVRDAAVLAFDGLTPDEYRAKVARALDEVAGFFELLPRPSPGAKKNLATDGSPSSPNGSAAPTAGALPTRSGSSRPRRPPCSGGAGRRDPAATKRAR